MEEIQEATSHYLVKIPTPNTNIMDTADQKMNYIESFLQDYDSYPGPPTKPINNISYPSAKEHLTPDLIAEVSATTADTVTASILDLSEIVWIVPG